MLICNSYDPPKIRVIRDSIVAAHGLRGGRAQEVHMQFLRSTVTGLLLLAAGFGGLAVSPGQADAQYYRWSGYNSYPYYWSGYTNYYTPYNAYNSYYNWYGT